MSGIGGGLAHCAGIGSGVARPPGVLIAAPVAEASRDRGWHAAGDRAASAARRSTRSPLWTGQRLST